MVKYAENELLSINSFSKHIKKLINAIKNNNLEKIGILDNNHLEVVVLSTEEYNRLKKIEENNLNQQWDYWQDEELDNFGKIAIGLSLNDYDDEDYSKW
jgi:PHD/YefM family antitoxin component YafN of YafNO toxin-antitoxin module